MKNAIAAALFASTATAQSISPAFQYAGINRPIAVTIDLAGATEASIALLTHDNQQRASAPVSNGQADLAELFPTLWDRPESETPRPPLLYAQLVIDGERQGSALVLQPLVSPARAVETVGDLDGDGRVEATVDVNGDQQIDVVVLTSEQRQVPFNPNMSSVAFPPDAPGAVTYSGLRLYQEQHVILETSEGTIEFAMRPDHAPNTVSNFRHLADNGFYNDVLFHRVIDQGGGGRFVIQAGDPTGTGSGGPGYNIDLENSTLPHDFGVISMARSSDPDSNGSQFFVCLSRQGTQVLDGRYTAFGQAVGGADVINAIARTPITPRTDRPSNPPSIIASRLIPAPPSGQAPAPVSDPDAPTQSDAPAAPTED